MILEVITKTPVNWEEVTRFQLSILKKEKNSLFNLGFPFIPEEKYIQAETIGGEP